MQDNFKKKQWCIILRVYMRAFLRKYRVKFKSMNMDILKHLGNNNVTFLLYFKNLKLRLKLSTDDKVFKLL